MWRKKRVVFSLCTNWAEWMEKASGRKHGREDELMDEEVRNREKKEERVTREGGGVQRKNERKRERERVAEKVQQV